MCLSTSTFFYNFYFFMAACESGQRPRDGPRLGPDRGGSSSRPSPQPGKLASSLVLFFLFSFLLVLYGPKQKVVRERIQEGLVSQGLGGGPIAARWRRWRAENWADQDECLEAAIALVGVSSSTKDPDLRLLVLQHVSCPISGCCCTAVLLCVKALD